MGLDTMPGHESHYLAKDLIFPVFKYSVLFSVICRTVKKVSIGLNAMTVLVCRYVGGRLLHL